MNTNLVINPSDNFIKKSNEFNNLFADRFIYEQCETKKITDEFFSSRLDYVYRVNNFDLTNILFYEILECIKNELNSIFEKNFNQKFFEIIIGAWLRKFIQQFIIKYKNIIEIKKDFNIQCATIYDTENYNFLTSETHTIQHATRNNLWNSCIYSHILSNISSNIEFEIIQPAEENFDDKNFLVNGASDIGGLSYLESNKNFKQILVDYYGYLANLLPNNANFFMYNTGIRISNEKKIDLKFGQLPRLYKKEFKFNYSSFDKNLRKKINFQKFVKVNNKNSDKSFVEIFNLIIQILSKTLPLTVLEDFNKLIKFSETLNFPKNPKAVCTSYAFESNEPFKYYLAMKKFINPKLKYFVYQHGGSYITRVDNSYQNETMTCDYFITWGDKTDITKKNNIKFVNFKLLNRKFFKNEKLDKLLILTRSKGYNAVPYDRYTEGLDQLNLTVKLCKKFSDEIKKNTIIRVHYSYLNSKIQLKELPDFKIDYSQQNYFEAINSAKLILFNHDSTGMLEMFTSNKPTLCLWENGEQAQNTFVVEDYELLKKAKILFDDKDKLNDHLNKIWSNPLEWWYSDSVQNNLDKFVNLYTKIPDKNFNNNFEKIIKDRI